MADQLTEELGAAKVRIDTLEAAIAAAKARAEHKTALSQQREETTKAVEQNRSLADRLQAVTAELSAATAKNAEVERRAGELRSELDRAHKDGDELRKTLQAVTSERDQMRSDLAAVKAKAEAVEEAHQKQRRQAAAETHRMAESFTRVQAERDAARKEAKAAREEAATLRGRVEVLNSLVSPDDRKRSGSKKAEKKKLDS